MIALLEIQNVSKTFSRGGLFSRHRIEAVKDVSFKLESTAPEIFAIIGESGSGKTTLSRMILGMQSATSGNLFFEGITVTKKTRRDRMAYMAQVQPIFQNPFEAFNPLKPVDYYLYLTAMRFGGASGQSEAEKHADESLRQVGLSLSEIRGRFPHEMSGGQLQRIAIARALVSKPKLIIADEPVSMVDASLRMSIINLFGDLRDRLGISIIYITHDLATAYYIADRLIIMQKGQIVEKGPARQVLSDPQHPYSRQLRDAVLSPEMSRSSPIH